MCLSSNFLIVKKSSLKKPNKIVYGRFESLHGELLVAFENDFLCAVQFTKENDLSCGLNELAFRFPFHPLFFHQKKVLTALISMKKNPVILLKGTSFQTDVWIELLKIPHGERVSYEDMAQKMHDRRKARAVGNAVGRNPIAILVPCHRVIRKDGTLGGYYWGVQKKISLLRSEKKQLQKRDIFSLLGISLELTVKMKRIL